MDLLKNKNIIFGQIHLLSSDILNDERIWDVILERSKHEYGKVPHILIFNKLNDVSKHNLKIMHGLFLFLILFATINSKTTRIILTTK